MRKWIDRVRKLAEGEVVDFMRAKREKERAETPQHDKYAVAKVKQMMNLGDTPVNHPLAPEINAVIDATLHAMIKGEELPADIKDRARNLSLIFNYTERLGVWHAISDIVLAFNKKYPAERVMWQTPNRRAAYLKDDESLNKHSITPRGGERIVFPGYDDFAQWVVEHLLPRVPEAVEDPKRKAAIESIPQMLKQGLLDDLGHYDSILAPYEEHKPFDPMTDRQWEHDIIPRAEKILQSLDRDWSKGADDDDIPSWVSYTALPDMGYSVTLYARHAPTRKFTFASPQEMEQWVIANEKFLRAWHARQQKRKPASDKAIARMIIPEIQKGIRTILAGNADPEAMQKFGWAIREKLDYMSECGAKQVMSSILLDFSSPRMWKFFSEYHLTWLPERVAEEFAKEG